MNLRLCAASAVLSLVAAGVHAADADIDLTFAIDGSREYDFAGAGAVDRAFDARAVGTRYVVLESRGPAAGTRFFRLVTIDERGNVIADAPSDVSDSAVERGIVTVDGGALIATREFVDARAAAVVVKLRADGTRDPGFGMNGRAVLTHPTRQLIATSVHADAQGRITVGGYSYEGTQSALPYTSFVGRFTAAGLPQPGFGVTGLGFYNQTPDGNEYVEKVLGHSSGAVYACGSAQFVGSRYATLARFGSAGGQDMSYGSSGLAIYTADTPQQNRATFCTDVAEQPTTARTWMAVDWRFGGPPQGGIRAFPLSSTGDLPVAALDLIYRLGGYPDGVSLDFDDNGRPLVITSNRNSSLEYDLQLGRGNSVGAPDANFGGSGQVDAPVLAPPFVGTHIDTDDAVRVFTDRGHIVAVVNYHGDVTYEGFVVYRFEGTTPFRDGFE